MVMLPERANVEPSATVETAAPRFTLAARSEGGKVTSPAVFRLTIQNQGDRTYQIEEVKLDSSDAFGRLRPGALWVFKCPATTLVAKRALPCELRAPSVSPSDLRLQFSADTLFFLPGEYPVVAIVKYRLAVQGKPQQTEQVETKLTLDPPLSSLMVGGVLGSLLLVLFIAAHRCLQILRAEGLPKRTRDRWLAFPLRLASQALFGAIVAIITIVLIQRVADLELPIRIEVNDFLGGIIIGLFSAKLGEALHKQFLG